MSVAVVSSASAMRASFEWGPTKKCFDSNTPPIKLTDVPKGTTQLEVKMVDTNAMDFNHGGGKVAYTGQSSLPYGAVKYKGPCPPSGTHFYSITVKALDANGKTLATAKDKKPFAKK